MRWYPDTMESYVSTSERTMSGTKGSAIVMLSVAVVFIVASVSGISCAVTSQVESEPLLESAEVMVPQSPPAELQQKEDSGTGASTVQGTGLTALLSEPAIVAVGTLPGDCKALEIEAEHLLAGCGSELRVYGLTQPNAPSLEGTVDLGFPSGAVAASAGRAYVATRDGMLRVVDITSPAMPTIMSELNIAATYPSAIVIDDNIVYVGNRKAGEGANDVPGVRVVDVTNPMAPALVRSIGTNDAEVMDLAILGNGGTLALALWGVGTAGNVDFVDVDISNARAVITATYVAGADVSSVAVISNTLYATAFDPDVEARLDVVDVGAVMEPMRIHMIEYELTNEVTAASAEYLDAQATYPWLGVMAASESTIVTEELHRVREWGQNSSSLLPWIRWFSLASGGEPVEMASLRADVQRIVDLEIFGTYVFGAAGFEGIAIWELIP